MNRILSLLTVLVFIFSSVQASQASPLVFKATREIKNPNEKEYVALAVFDTSKYKQIRVGIVSQSEKTPEPDFAQIYAVEDGNSIFIERFVISSSRSVLIDSPSTKVKVSVRKSGTYKIFIWASL